MNIFMIVMLWLSIVIQVFAVVSCFFKIFNEKTTRDRVANFIASVLNGFILYFLTQLL